MSKRRLYPARGTLLRRRPSRSRGAPPASPAGSPSSPLNGGPETIRVRSEDNLFQHVETLKRNRAKRHRFREFLVEGVKSIKLARAHDWPIKALLYDAERPLSNWAEETLADMRSATRIALPSRLMARLSEKVEPSELLAVAGMAENRVERIALDERALVVVFDRPVSPGNLGAVIRSCDALGASGLVVTGHGADIYAPQTIRASMGSFFALPVIQLESHLEVQQWVTNERGQLCCQIVGGSGEEEAALDEIDLTRPTVLVVGNETAGLSHGYKALCEVLVRIPMQGAADSLNVACAASILLYEASRQRRKAPST